MTGETGAGLLYWAPAGTEWPADEWVPLGTVDEGTRYDVPTDGELSFRTDGRCASVSFPIGAISPYGYRLLFRRRHPRITAMRRAYRRKIRRRR